MISIDFVGVVFTVVVIAFQYPAYGLIAIVIHELGRIAMALILQGHINSIVAAGAFGAASVSGVDYIISILIALGGPLANYIISSTSGGLELEQRTQFINPQAELKSPFSVINLRLAVISTLFNAWFFMQLGG